MASLGNDLAGIRKEKDLSLDDIHEATKIPKDILASIEDDSIFADLENNPTYIRSYVRSYAKSLGINEQKIIDALDDLQEGNYSGSLLDSAKEQPQDLSEEEVNEDISPEDEQEEEEPSPPLEAENAPKEWPTEPEPPVAKSPSVQSIDWADMGKRFKPLKTPTPKIWLVIIAVVVVAAAGIYFFATQSGPESPEISTSAESGQTTAENQSADSLQLNIMPSASEQADTLQEKTEETVSEPQQMTNALPDTLQMLVYAAFGKLEPVRVYTDIMDGFNPYWIEQGIAMRFNFVNEMRIRGSLERLALIFNGHAVQNPREAFYNPETGLLEINRSFFENDGKWLSPAPDSLSINAPMPSTIKNRPTFN